MLSKAYDIQISIGGSNLVSRHEVKRPYRAWCLASKYRRGMYVRAEDVLKWKASWASLMVLDHGYGFNSS
uniref:Uncharacterized protein n=1 Tax=Physcomitrium patens TaxID=3218 RepID=A0A2K1L462_PHYPA|nr:hypothetical protein PHYPA_003603 [Physcomitrium patens]